jgi:hypothetical protein
MAKSKKVLTQFEQYEKNVRQRDGLRITNKPLVQIPFKILDPAWEDYIPLKPKTGTPIVTAMLGKVTRKGEVINLSYLEKSNLMGDGDSNAKTKKNDRYTLVLYLTPASKSGANFCEMASPGCIWSCLSQAGRGFFANVQQARLLKSYVVQDFELFFLQRIQKQIIAASKSSKRNKFKNKNEVAIRLNGTSDLPFLEMMNKAGLLDAIPNNVKFYDYTKFPNKAGIRKINKFDYVVTYSRCEDYFDRIAGKWVDNLNNALQNLEKGNTVAVVFVGNKLPNFWFGYQVIDGDERDDLMLDIPRIQGKGIVLGLKAKIPKGVGLMEWVAKSKDFIVECDSFDDCRSTGLLTIGK